MNPASLSHSDRVSGSKNDRTVIILTGPTGVGKTGLSIALAKALDTEIISADSMQIYRCMDIGTAKPSPEDQNEVRHHLVSIRSPQEPFSAGMFKKMAVDLIDTLHSESKIPVVVGGTGLYIRTLTQGLFEGPAADWTLREKLSQEEERYGRGHLYQHLKKIDPLSAEKINPNDLRRTIRAIEVAVKAGKTMSELHLKMTGSQKYHFITIGLSRERKELYGRIESRVDAMVKRGLVEETVRLLSLNPDRTPLQALGYKEVRLYITGAVSLDEAIRLIKKRTKIYARRQIAWLKRERDIQWVDITGIVERDEIFTRVISEVEILRKLL